VLEREEGLALAPETPRPLVQLNPATIDRLLSTHRSQSQEAVREAIPGIRERLPFPLRGIDSDNGVPKEGVQFTRSLPSTSPRRRRSTLGRSTTR